jgi:hypothetical protein
MIHIILAEDRRISTEEKARQPAIPISNDIRVQKGVDAKGAPIYEVTHRPAQLHSMGERVEDMGNENILYAAEWDGVSPWIVVHKGSIADLKMAYMGWPMVEKEKE